MRTNIGFFRSVCGCCSPATLGHPHTELHRRLVDSSSIRAGSSSASRCRSRSHEGFGVKTKRKEKCASSSTEDHLSGRSVGLDHDAGSGPQGFPRGSTRFASSRSRGDAYGP